jgi:hypothetical protein
LSPEKLSDAALRVSYFSNSVAESVLELPQQFLGGKKGDMVKQKRLKDQDF